MAFDVSHPLLYGLAALVIVFVLGQSLFFLVKAWKRARELGLQASKLRKVATGSALFTLAPALGVVLGLFTMAQFLGLPLPWLRLSVLGAVTYELPAAATVAELAEIPSNVPITDPSIYLSIAWVMTLGILSGILVILFFQKGMEQRLKKVQQRDARWSAILMDALFMGMIAAFLGLVFKDIRHGLVGWIPVAVLLVSALLMALCGLLIKKLKWQWLESFALPIAMLGAMALSIPLDALMRGVNK